MGTTEPSQIISKELRPTPAPGEEEFDPKFEEGYESRKVYLDKPFQDRLIRLIEKGFIHPAISLLFGRGKFINRKKLDDVPKKMFDRLSQCKDTSLLQYLIRHCYYFIPARGFPVKKLPVAIRIKPGVSLVLETRSDFNTDILVMLYNSF